MLCKKCGAETLAEGAVYCAQCGNRLDGKIQCHNCNQFNDGINAFCVYCGTRIDGKSVCKNCGATYHVSNNPSKKEGICDECGGALEMRKDDVPEVIRHRLEVYNEQTKPLKDFYKERDLLVTVKGCDEVDETKDAILKALRETIEA